MCPADPLPVVALRRRVDPAEIPFATTAEVEPLVGLVGQERATTALRFGITIRHEGYNLFVIGPPGLGKRTLVRQDLAAQAAAEPTPADWCYVHNFADPMRPRALALPAGTGARLRSDLDGLIADLRLALPSAFESEEHRDRRQRLVKGLADRQESIFVALQQQARQRHVAVIRSDNGVLIAPLGGEEVLEPERFAQLAEDERAALEQAMEETRDALAKMFRDFHDWTEEQRAALRALERDLAARIIHQQVSAVAARHAALPAVTSHLAAIEADLVEHASAFLEASGAGVEAMVRQALSPAKGENGPFRRYRINLLIDHAGAAGAPVIWEDQPTHANLLGRIEHVSELGTLITDFTLIRPGALHRANGGYLLLEVVDVLRQPFAWDALKRALRNREIRIQPLGQLLGLTTTTTLEPEPIPLAPIKVVLLGDRMVYYLLAELDPDVLELFKVLVDFAEEMDRRAETQVVYARLVATLVTRERLLPFDRNAVARVLEQAARLAGDGEKLSVHLRPVVDLLREADHCARQAARSAVEAADVEAAIAAQHARAGRVADLMREQIRRGILHVATSGREIGQINGLSVLRLGDLELGRPTRITARCRLGRGELVDIEREVELGGPLHSKGVMILSGFLGGRFATQIPLALSASLVFEQSYGPVEGDSASLAELCVLLSAIAELPLRQDLAVTGSVDQLGNVQPVGAINDKIEGFFDACAERGLTGEQGVLVPESNVVHLMLRPDVVAAVAAGRFRVWAVGHVDAAMELLTGHPAGARDDDGSYPDASVNATVEERLAFFAASARAFAEIEEVAAEPGAPG